MKIVENLITCLHRACPVHTLGNTDIRSLNHFDVFSNLISYYF